jgi:Ni/Fe-hydrogenase subunit HybB-like protein
MKENDLALSIHKYRIQSASRQLRFAMTLFVVIGAIMLIGAFLGVEQQRIYQIYLVNFAFWTGLSQAGVAFAAAYRMTNARWSESFKRIGELFAAFLPVSIVLLLVILVVQQSLYPWIDEPLPKKALWLNSSFFTIRLLLYFGIMTVMSIYYVYLSFRPDLGLLRTSGEYGLNDDSLPSRIAARFTRNWKGFSEEYRISREKLKIFTPIFLLSYAIIYTFVGFDLLMTLDPHWFSTLYGWLFIVSGFYSGVVAITLTGYFVRRGMGSGELIGTGQFHDIGKLILGFCMFTGGLVWSQYLTIWYGNIPEETAHIIVRYHAEPWALLTTVVILTAYFIPLVFLFSKKVKQTPIILFGLGVVILTALWLNRFVDAIPSVWHESTIPFGIFEIGITLGFFGAIVLSWLWLARIVPLIPAHPEQ